MKMVIPMTMRFTIKKNDKVRNGPKERFEEGLLFIDCRSCPGDPSFGSKECVLCVSSAIERNGKPSRLMVRKDADTEYSESVISVLSEISKINSLTRAASSENLSTKCRNCGSSLPKNAKDILGSFPEPRFDIIRSEAERSNPGKEGCEECLWRTIGFIDRLETMFSDLRKEAAKKAFRLTEV